MMEPPRELVVMDAATIRTRDEMATAGLVAGDGEEPEKGKEE
jgi:hypothetical protein